MTTKAYVIVTNLPPTLKGSGFFYNLLKKQVGGGLLGAVMEDESTIGLAIFDNVQSALAACKENIVFKSQKDSSGNTMPYIASLKIVETENQARAVEDVWVDTVTVEGVKIKKDQLENTYGLQRALRGLQGFKWCSHTENKESCPLSTKCKFLHLKEYQTVRKRLRTSASDTVSSLSEERNILLSSLKGLPFTQIPLASVTLTPKVASALLAGDLDALRSLAYELFGNASDTTTRERAASFLKMESELVGSTELDIFTETENGIKYLKEKAKCVLPSNSAPTPPEKDAFIREIIKRRNIGSALIAREHVDAITAANGDSASITEAHIRRLNIFFSSPAIQAQLANAPNITLRITLVPRLDISSVLQEMTFFIKDSIVVCVTQHYDDVLAPGNLFDENGMLSDEYNFINERARNVRSALEQWAKTQSSSVSAAVHVAFPAKVLKAESLPTQDSITPSPSSLLHLPEAISSDQFTNSTPVILNVKLYDAATARSSLFSGSVRDETRTTRPLWRRLKTSPTPMFERSTIDKFAAQ